MKKVFEFLLGDVDTDSFAVTVPDADLISCVTNAGNVYAVFLGDPAATATMSWTFVCPLVDAEREDLNDLNYVGKYTATSGDYRYMFAARMNYVIAPS